LARWPALLAPKHETECGHGHIVGRVAGNPEPVTIMIFRIKGLSPDLFRHLFGLGDAELAAHGARRMIADKTPGYPDRIELRDVEPGQSLLLLNYTHQPAATPYRSSHAIFVREGASKSYDRVGEVPEVLRSRLISLRAFDAADMMVDADVMEGRAIEQSVVRMLSAPRVAYLHAHYAKRGCYAACIERI
jgi:Protein of unknown function (DUF1203)